MYQKSTLARLAAVITGGLVLFAASGASAGLIGVKHIVITSANPNLLDNWIQISEVIAIETGGSDVALAATATASSKMPLHALTSLGAAIDGIGPSGYPDIFHSGTHDEDEFYKITLNAVTELDSIEIMGRADPIGTRDIFNVEFLDENDATLLSLFDLSAVPANNHTTGTVALSAPSQMPEPATLALFGLGLGGLGFARRRKSA